MSKKNENWIFLPATGCYVNGWTNNLCSRDAIDLDANAACYGYYWTKNVFDDNQYAYCLDFTIKGYSVQPYSLGNTIRADGLTVRPVRMKK